MPSALAHGANWPRTPREMSIDDIAGVQRDFAAAALRALDAGAGWAWPNLPPPYRYWLERYNAVD